ncbi:LMBR1L isoform 20, partial [Pan troglodytes]
CHIFLTRFKKPAEFTTVSSYKMGITMSTYSIVWTKGDG